MKPSLRLTAGTFLLLLCAAQSATAQYVFAPLAQFAPRAFQFVQNPPIDVHGSIAYMSPSNQSSLGVAGLFVNSRITLHPTSLVRSGFVDARSRSLDDFGNAAYVQDGVYVTNGHDTRTISDPPDDEETQYHNAALNNLGTVAFEADLDEDGNTAIYLRQLNGDLIAISDGSVDPLNFHSPPALDEQDRVVFSAYDGKRLSTDVYAFDGGVVTLTFDNGVAPVISRAGVVAFTRLGQANGATMVFRGSLDGGAFGAGQPVVLISDSSGPFTRVLADGVNDSGQVIFRGILPGGDMALCVGDGNTITRVVQTGDHLRGRVVSNLSPGSINNAGQIAFEAIYTDQSAEILRGTPKSVGAGLQD